MVAYCKIKLKKIYDENDPRTKQSWNFIYLRHVFPFTIKLITLSVHFEGNMVINLEISFSPERSGGLFNGLKQKKNK